MRVAVTGATGYVGGPLVARLLAGGATVRAIVRTPDAPLPAGVERALGDLTAAATLGPALADVDAVVHCAAEQRSPSRARHRLVNVEGTHALLDAAVAAGVRRVVHLSSVAVYPQKGPGAVVGPEDAVDPLPELRDAYAWSKIGAERWVALYGRAGALDVVTLRLGIVYGRGRDFVARVWRRIAGPVVAIGGTPRMLLPLVHVDDVAEAVWRALETPRLAAHVLHVVGPELPTQRAYLERRAAHGRGRVVALYLPVHALGALARRRAWRDALVRPRRASRTAALAWGVQTTRYDVRPTERTLGWRPRIGLDEGLRGPGPIGPVPMGMAG